MLRQRKVRFIEPGGRPGRPFNEWLGRWPLLGPITLATILHERGYDAAVYNENASGPLEDNAEGYADICSADVVGISVMTSTACRGYAIARRLRRDAPGVRIVFGGVHATFRPEEALAYADIVVCGEGETVIEPIARGDIDSGIVRAQPLADLDELPTLNHFLMRDFDRLLARSRHRRFYELPVMTSRGCPHGCTYCSVTPMFGRKVRRQSVAKVHADVSRHAEQGFRSLFFYDDNLTADREWAKALLERLRPMRLQFSAQARVDLHWKDGHRRERDDDMLRAMRRAGCGLLYIGYETIDDDTARQWHKGYRGDQALVTRLQEDTRILHDHGVWIHAMFVMGPQHTARTADQIVDFARRCQIETLQISILTPFPGTALFEEMRPHLLLDDFPTDWEYYDATHCVYSHGRLGIEGTQRAVLDAHRRFYRTAGWSGRSLRHVARRRMSTVDKLLDIWRGIKVARRTMSGWRRDTEAFLQLVRDRTSSREKGVREKGVRNLCVDSD